MGDCKTLKITLRMEKEIDYYLIHEDKTLKWQCGSLDFFYENRVTGSINNCLVSGVG